jgi:hypothetical protein
MGVGAKVFANVGSGCDALGVPSIPIGLHMPTPPPPHTHTPASASASALELCTSGIVAWQLHAPGLNSPIPILLPTKAASLQVVSIELFVDQQICELYVIGQNMCSVDVHFPSHTCCWVESSIQKCDLTICFLVPSPVLLSHTQITPNTEGVCMMTFLTCTSATLPTTLNELKVSA